MSMLINIIIERIKNKMNRMLVIVVDKLLWDFIVFGLVRLNIDYIR